jgi:hypothetical protein
MSFKFNGRTITSASQLEREFKKLVDRSIDDTIRKAAGSDVRLTKTREGFLAEGTQSQLDSMVRRLK